MTLTHFRSTYGKLQSGEDCLVVLRVRKFINRFTTYVRHTADTTVDRLMKLLTKVLQTIHNTNSSNSSSHISADTGVSLSTFTAHTQRIKCFFKKLDNLCNLFVFEYLAKTPEMLIINIQ